MQQKECLGLFGGPVSAGEAVIKDEFQGSFLWEREGPTTELFPEVSGSSDSPGDGPNVSQSVQTVGPAIGLNHRVRLTCVGEVLSFF